MYSLSTNCVYVEAYRLAARIANELGDGSADSWERKAADLKNAINREFWMEDKGTYRYLVDPFGGCDYQEGLGISFAVLFGIADDNQIERILESAETTPYGIACVWPSFQRYRVNEQTFGRHCGTVWPFIQGFWAEAALAGGRKDLFDSEFFKLTWLAFHSDGFYELYHPLTGQPYGGVQEGIRWSTWPSVPRQTWSATAYFSMVLHGIFGLRFSTDGLTFQPSLPEGITSASLKKLSYRKAVINITLEGSGSSIKSVMINGKPENFIPADAEGSQEVRIELE